MRKTDKSLLIFIFTIVIITASVILAITFAMNQRFKTNAELSDMAWPNGPALIMFNQAYGDMNVRENIYPGVYFISTDEKIKADFVNGNEYEYLGGNEILFSGVLRDTAGSEAGKIGLYYITLNGVKEIYYMDNPLLLWSLSVSTKKNYIKYLLNDELCISDFSFDEMGECKLMQDYLPEEYSDNEKYYFDGDWMKDQDLYVIRIRSKINSHWEPSEHEGQPDLLIRNEVARFVYDPAEDKIEQMNLDESIILKTKNYFVGEVDYYVNDYFKSEGGYEYLYDYVGGRVIVKEKSTGKKAALIDANYYSGDIPGFSIQ